MPILFDWFPSDYESGGLNLNAGHFAQLSRLVSCGQHIGISLVVRSCVDVPSSNCIPVLSLSVSDV